jgi:hypothetical protein
MASLGTVCLSTLFTFVALGHMAGFTALFSGNGLMALLLALSPYVVFCGACFLARRSSGRAIATFVVCALASAFAIVFYVDLVFLNPGSMNGLVFYFVPVCQLAAGDSPSNRPFNRSASYPSAPPKECRCVTRPLAVNYDSTARHREP